VLFLFLVATSFLAIIYAYQFAKTRTLLGDLREKMSVADSEKSSLCAENSILYAQLQEANAEIERLNDQVQERTHYEIDKTDIEIPC